MMPFANDGRGSCLWADRYYRLNNMGVVTWLMWIFSCNLTSVSYFTEVGELFQLAKSSGCANRQNPGEWEFEGCVNYKFRCVLLCINTQCQKPLLRGVVYVNCEGRCCCSSCSNPWLAQFSLTYPCVLCVWKLNNCWRSQYLNMNVNIIHRNGY